jgi:hypothetical protein
MGVRAPATITDVVMNASSARENPTEQTRRSGFFPVRLPLGDDD